MSCENHNIGGNMIKTKEDYIAKFEKTEIECLL